jgi:hypothetical protein
MRMQVAALAAILLACFSGQLAAETPAAKADQNSPDPFACPASQGWPGPQALCTGQTR